MKKADPEQIAALRRELLALRDEVYDTNRRKLFMDVIIARLIAGQTITEIARADDTPSRNVIAKWRTDNVDGFRDRYEQAILTRAEFMVDEMQEIADDGRNDWIERENTRTGNVSITLNSEAVQRSRLRIDQRQWTLSRLLPTLYGDKLQLRHAGNDGQPIAMDKLTSDDLRALREITIRATDTTDDG